MSELSIIITVKNEEESVKPLLESIPEALAAIDYEILLIDDGSTDKTKDRIIEFGDNKTTLIEFRKNYGQSAAMMAGVDFSKGKYVAFLDGDLQNDPADIPHMLQLLKKGDWDMVAGNRKNRKDGWLLRKVPSRIANALIRSMTGVHIKDYGCTLKIIKKEIATDLNLYGELHRFIPVLAAQLGARITETDVTHHPRIHGKSKYGINRTFKVVSDLLLMIFRQKYMHKPMHFFGRLGLISFALGIASFFCLLMAKMGNHQHYWSPIFSVAGIIFFLGGIQLIGLGIIADMNIKHHFESKHRRPYQVRNIIPGKEKISA
jgi:glycosyltransferase involved in cell wall biosynthesis